MTSTLSNTRRDFLMTMMLTAGATGMSSALISREAEAATLGPLTPKQFRKHALQLRKSVAEQNAANGSTEHPTNGDDDRYPTRFASYSKGLQHDDAGEVVATSYSSLLYAISTGSFSDFDLVPLGGVRPIIGAHAGLAYELEGGDPRSYLMPVPPRFNSLEQAAEMTEQYWMALLRDVPFDQYGSNPIAAAAAEDLSSYGSSALVAKNASGTVTPDVLFRGTGQGDLVGPYLSQFFYFPIAFGPYPVDHSFVSYAPGVDFLTDYSEWLAAQRGAPPAHAAVAGPKRYPINGRDLGRWVHVDFVFEAYLLAGLTLNGRGAPLNPLNPYRNTTRQAWLNMFTELTQSAGNALRAAFYEKWFVHRRLRPEVFAARVHRTLYNGAAYPVHHRLLDSISSASGLGRYLTSGNALLAQAYPEGSPTHPSYPAAHATIAGACVTILKAIFDGSWVIPNPVQPNADGSALVPYTGAPLTVQGELEKLASNVALGRNIAGVHWRSDSSEGLRLGESVALQFLSEYVQTTNEDMHFSLTTFDGEPVVI